MILSHLCRVESSTSTLWTGLSPIKGMSGSLSLLSCLTEIHICNANSVDSDQMTRSVVFDLGLHCCQCPFYGTQGINRIIKINQTESIYKYIYV